MLQPSLAAGDKAPDFELATSGGSQIHFYETLERSPVVLFFYVKAFTPLCTAEVCAFRDNAKSFAHVNCTLFGVSSDAPATARRFASFHRLPFPLLLDSDNYVRKLYRVPKLLGVLPGRATFVIDQDRLIEQVTYAPFQSMTHVMKSLDALHKR